jgi:beta-lactamase regulating signal transducer with metallopeptidase domain
MSASTSLADALLWYAASNLVLVLPVAILAWWIQTRLERPLVAHLLWLLVLIKLLMPSMVSIPLALLRADDPELIVASSQALVAPAWSMSWKTAALFLWLAGSALIAVRSLYCIVRFDRLLKLSSLPAETELQAAGDRLARRLGLRRSLAIFSTSASISPMVWWIGGRPRIYLPAALTAQRDAPALRPILAHELAHIRRADHLVRWLEWVVCIALWWNPVAWWARRNLRRTEELCCDAHVVSTLELEGGDYARSLLSALEVLSTPLARPPAMASEINGGGFMERRIKMIVSKKSMTLAPRWLRNTVLLGAAMLLPLGFSIAQDADDFSKVESWLESGVNSAFITPEQKKIMLEALYRNANAFNISLMRVTDRDAVIRQQTALKEYVESLEQQVATGQITKAAAAEALDEARSRARTAQEQAEARARTEALQAQ